MQKTWMDMDIIMLSEIIQAQNKTKQNMCFSYSLKWATKKKEEIKNMKIKEI